MPEKEKEGAMAKLKTTLFIILSCASTAMSQASPELPNILWIVSEDNSPFLGAYGDKFATTPNLDRLAKEGILYENAFAVAPVCSPTRSTIITGVYATSLGTEHMRSKYPIPDQVRFFPEYLKNAGYYTTNNTKTDYNTSSEGARMKATWDESGNQAHYMNRRENQPFFAVFNLTHTHESSIFRYKDQLSHDPEKVPIPPYLPPTPEMKHDWAHYYDNIEAMDTRVGELLRELDDNGLSENTIVFYYSDHGGILGRSKQYLYDSGLHVPFIVRIPHKYRHLAGTAAGSRTDRMISFVDLAPTVLSLAGLPIPEYMEGAPFMGKHEAPPREYIYCFRGRMDERNDMSRGVRDKRFFYRRNFMPHRIYGQHIQYHWRAPSVRSWEEAYKNGELNEVQSRFWREKEPEELYDVISDPHQIRNLAGDPAYAGVLRRMRNAQRDWALKFRDTGYIPETIMEEISKAHTLYEYARSRKYRIKTIIGEVEKMISGDKATIRKNLAEKDPVLKYWAATACINTRNDASGFKEILKILSKDREIAVRIASSEALYRMGDTQTALNTLMDVLKDNNIIGSLLAMDVLEIMGADAAPALAYVKEYVVRDPVKFQVYEIKASTDRLIGEAGDKP